VTDTPRRFTRGAAARLRAPSAVALTFRRRRALVGLLYIAPAFLFVLVFTMVPFLQMIWVSFHNWSLITPPRFIGLSNFERALSDDQFWVSLGFTLKYTLLITPILMIGGYLIAVMTSTNTRLRRLTRTVLFVPVVIGLSASSLLWFWLFSPNYCLINQFLIDIGMIASPILWLGVDADRSNWAVITSVVWKVLGFGVVLFVAAIQAIPSEVNEASMVDGAGLRQRVARVILPMTMRTVLLVTLVSVIGSLLAFDQFYLMTAGQPHNETATSVFWVYQNSFPFLKLGYGAALSLILAAIILAFTVGQMVLTRRSHA
jgi:multiple sugar transport system permease protein